MSIPMVTERDINGAVPLTISLQVTNRATASGASMPIGDYSNRDPVIALITAPRATSVQLWRINRQYFTKTERAWRTQRTLSGR